MLTLWPSSPTPRYISNECLCSPKDVFKKDHSSFIHNCPKLETTQLAIKTRMKWIVLYSYNAVTHSNGKRQPKLRIHTIIWMTLTDIMLNIKNQRQMISFMIQFMSPPSSQNDSDRDHNSHYLWGWDPEQETGGGVREPLSVKIYNRNILCHYLPGGYI